MNAVTSLPADVGVGFKPEHARDVIEGERAVAFFEVHAENYMGAGGPPHAILERLRASYPLSLHGVGLSVGGARPLDRRHLARLRRLIARYQPSAFSEHLAWSTHDGAFFNDLLPVPYNGETLALVCEHIDQIQTALRTRMLLENPSTYVAFETSTMSELEFLREVVCRTGCGLLLDVNNLYVSAVNHTFDPVAYLDAFPVDHVGEIHLAGFAEDHDGAGARLLIDSHECEIAETVWFLYHRTLGRIGSAPTLIEWDNDVPAFRVLVAQARRAQTIMTAEAMSRGLCPVAA